jgi:hypothetical protein
MEEWMTDQEQFPEPEQEHIRAVIRSIDVAAPPHLRAAVEEQIRAAVLERRRPLLRLPAFRILAFPAAALAAAVVALVLVLGGGGTAPPTLGQAASLALRQPSGTAPKDNGVTLDVSSAGIPFPYWQRSVGWSAIGRRTDRLDGRRVVTVFYAAPHAAWVGYSIVGGAPLHASGGQVVSRHGIEFRLMRDGMARLVTWERQGHTCVIAGQGTSDRILLRLATADVPQ